MLTRRRRIAAFYDENIRHPEISLPPRDGESEPSYHQYVVRCQSREAVTEALTSADIDFGIHYPLPIHLMPAYDFLGGDSLDLPTTVQASHGILSLPVHEALDEEEALEVTRVLNSV